MKQLSNKMLIQILTVCTIVCISLSIIRCHVTETRFFLFLNINLFLAFIPLLISSLVIKSNLTNKYFLIGIGIIWLLFLPNAPYILTDLIHLKPRKLMPLWFDIAMLSSFGFTGLLYGFASLKHFEDIASRYFTKSSVTLLSMIVLFLCGIGIYLGRFLRWNSWDMLQKPTHILGDLYERIINPIEHTSFLVTTIIIGITLNLLYYFVNQLQLSKSK
jgi:uncharacterized membrane protein